MTLFILKEDIKYEDAAVIPESDSTTGWEFPFHTTSNTASYAPTCWLNPPLIRASGFKVLVTNATKPFAESAPTTNSAKNEPQNDSPGFRQAWIHPEETQVPSPPNPGPWWAIDEI